MKICSKKKPLNYGKRQVQVQSNKNVNNYNFDGVGGINHEMKTVKLEKCL